MPRLSLVLALLAPLTLACGDDKDGTGASEGGSATDGTGSGPNTTSASMSEPNTASASMSEPTTTGDDTASADPDEAATQLCVDTINMYRATLGLTPLQRWSDAEDCSDAECVSDGNSGTPHGAFGMCGEAAQNECPGWPGPPDAMITGCLELMWAEGPGEDFNAHGHYINMSSTDYTKVACGFAEVNGEIWSVQNFQ
jgi:hypothetical protein